MLEQAEKNYERAKQIYRKTINRELNQAESFRDFCRSVDYKERTVRAILKRDSIEPLRKLALAAVEKRERNGS